MPATGCRSGCRHCVNRPRPLRRAVIEFKAKNNIVTTGGGTLMNEKQLGDISGQLAEARSHASDLQARLERIAAVRQAYQQDQPASAVDENVSEAMSNAHHIGVANSISGVGESRGRLVGSVWKKSHRCCESAQPDPRDSQIYP